MPAATGFRRQSERRTNGIAKRWSLTTLRAKLIKIGAQVVRQSKYAAFQMDEVAVLRELFAAIFERIQRFDVPSPLAQPE